jgi:hypothetical protein
LRSVKRRQLFLLGHLLPSQVENTALMLLSPP